MTADEIAIKYGLCSCDEAYTKRGLTAPDCPWHAFAIEEAMEEYADLKIAESQKWIKIDSEADLPKEIAQLPSTVDLFVIRINTNRIEIFSNFNNTNPHDLSALHSYCTHYIPITKPQPPKD